MLKRECTSASAVSIAGSLQIREVRRELLRQQHAFVDERLVRQAGDVPGRRAFQRRRADLAVGALANDVELALERQLVGDLPGCGR